MRVDSDIVPMEGTFTVKADFEPSGDQPAAIEELERRLRDGEKDVVAVLKPEDLPLVRKVRRVLIAAANPHAAEYYDSFTGILMTFVWRPELVK